MTLGYEYDYEKKRSHRKEWFKYESFKAEVPYLGDKYKLRKIEKDTFMDSYDYYNTNWKLIKMTDSIQTVEEIKQLNKQNNIE